MSWEQVGKGVEQASGEESQPKVPILDRDQAGSLAAYNEQFAPPKLPSLDEISQQISDIQSDIAQAQIIYNTVDVGTDQWENAESDMKRLNYHLSSLQNQVGGGAVAEQAGLPTEQQVQPPAENIDMGFRSGDQVNVRRSGGEEENDWVVVGPDPNRPGRVIVQKNIAGEYVPQKSITVASLRESNP
jgi:hypothetical protein